MVEHQSLKVLVDLGQKEVDCVITEFSEEKEKSLNIALNKINGERDTGKLAMLISDLQGSDFDVSLTGVDEDELADLFEKSEEIEVMEDEFDLTAELEKGIVCKTRRCLDSWQAPSHVRRCNKRPRCNCINGRKTCKLSYNRSTV